MNWYRIEAVRDALLDYGAALAPSAIGSPNVEAWRRAVGGHVYTAFLNYHNDEFLVPEGPLAAQALRIPPREFLDRVKGRGGLWTGPSPAG